MSFYSLLNTTCNIQVRTNTQDAAGQPIPAWANSQIDVKCRLNGATGDEFRGENQVLARITHILFTEIGVGALDTGEYRISCGGNTYDILIQRDAGGHGHHYEFGLELIK